MTVENLTGNVIRGYELHELIGEGGFGAVYRAVQTAVGREVVIKIILPQYASQPEFIRRFEAEAQLVARLEHPHIVPLFDYWREPSGAYLVMRLLRGGTLRDSLRKEGPWHPRRVARMLSQIASAITVAHRNNVVHRDVKPANILLDEADEKQNQNAYLTDFGIAKDTVGEGTQHHGSVIGSAGYMSPEQINLQPVTPRSDMYSMSLVVYEMLTGQHAYPDAKSSVALFIKHVNEPLPSIDSLPTPIYDVLQKAAAKDPEERYADMIEFAVAFKQAVSDTGAGPSMVGSDIEIEDWGTGSTTSSYLMPANAVENIQNPYKGLRAFQESDASDFYGRETLIKLLLTRMAEDHEYARFLAVVGPSGSGKSSVVKAGVLPALRQGGLPGSENWFVTEMLPGVNPLEELQTALLSVAANPVENVTQRVAADPAALNEVVNQILPGSDDSELVLVIDQFEEVFTQSTESSGRQLLDGLQHAIKAENSRLRVIVTLRADFYDRPLMVQDFSQLMQQRTEVVVPMTVDELERAITAPARAVKVFFQQGLAAQIVSEVNEQPGVLPMLQYALTELFERREGQILTTAAYQEIGGVLGALARRAEEIYVQLDEVRQEAVRQLFLRLVTLGEGTEDTRRRALQSEIISAAANPEIMQEIIDSFGSYRLLTYDRDPVTRGPTVEVAHEALIREWKRLRDWLDASREDVRLQRLLSAAATEWIESGRENSFLLRGGRLVQFEDWTKTTTIAMTAEEHTYVQASIEERQREEELERQRQEQQRRLEKRAQQRMRLVVVILTLAAIGGAILSFFIFQQSQEAVAAQQTSEANYLLAVTSAAEAAIANITSEANLSLAATNAADAIAAQAEAQEQANLAVTAQSEAQENELRAVEAQEIAVREAEEAQSLALAASAGQLVENNSPLALALAIEANNVPNPSLQAQRVLISVVYDAPRRGYESDGGSINDVILLGEPDNRQAFTANNDGTITKWDLEDGEVIMTFSGHTESVNSIDLSSNGSLLASGSDDNTIIIWDANTGEIIYRLAEHDASVTTVAFNATNTQLASGSEDTNMIIWNVNDGSVRERVEGGPTTINHVEFSPRGQNIVVAFEDALRMWNTSRSTFVEFVEPLEEGSDEIQISRVRYATFSDDGLFILSSGDETDARPQLWEVGSGTLIQEYPVHNGPVNSVAFSPDGQTVLSASDDFTLILSERETGEQIRQFYAHQSRVTQAVFDATGDAVLSVSGAGIMHLWDTAESAEYQRIENAHDDGVSNILFTPQDEMLTSAYDGKIRFWNFENSELDDEINLGRPDIPQTTLEFYYVADKAEATVLWGATDMRLLDVETGEVLQQFVASEERAWLEDIAISPDGTRAIWAGGYFFRDQLVQFTRAGLLVMWDTESGEIIRYFGEELLFPAEGNDISVTAVDFSPDGQTIVAGLDNGNILMWDINTGELVQEFDGHSDRVTELSFDATGMGLLSGAEDRALILWQVETGQILRRFIGHTGAINDVAFSPDELTIISGAEDSRLILWDRATGQVLRRFAGHDAPVISVAFSPDGEFALSGDLFGTILQWSIESPESLKEWARENRYIPEFSCAQREQFGLDPCEEISADIQATPAASDSARLPRDDGETIVNKRWISSFNKMD